ncbi:MAG: histone deacetylase, partial [Nitrospinae bacterium]|nr:histone deacetylase [Nitrospinota bacterium]
MRRTGFVYSPVYLKHDTGSHPENPARLTAIINRIEKEKLKDVLIYINPLKAAEEQISLIHN